jgi:hypothetical protein
MRRRGRPSGPHMTAVARSSFLLRNRKRDRAQSATTALTAPMAASIACASAWSRTTFRTSISSCVALSSRIAWNGPSSGTTSTSNPSSRSLSASPRSSAWDSASASRSRFSSVSTDSVPRRLRQLTIDGQHQEHECPIQIGCVFLGYARGDNLVGRGARDFHVWGKTGHLIQPPARHSIPGPPPLLGGLRR